MKSKPLVFAVLIVSIIVGALVWPYYPASFKAKIIRATSPSKWSQYERLMELLALGMEPAEVKRILGPPDRTIRLSNGECWVYLETGATAGWTFVAQFKGEERGVEEGRTPKLCYVENIQHVAFPNAKRSKKGQKLDMGEPEETLIFGIRKREGD